MAHIYYSIYRVFIGWIYPSSSNESTLSRHINYNQELHTYQWQNRSSSYSTITPQSFRRGLQTQVEQIGGDGTHLLPTKQQTRCRTMHSKQCATYSQMDGAYEDRRSILGMSICYSIWTWNRQGILTKSLGIWKSCGNYMPLPSGIFPKLINIE